MPPTPLNRTNWPPDAYDRDHLRERVLMFGTGMLLRALVATAVDRANHTGAFRGGIVALQSTPHGRARALNRQDGLFTLLERGLENREPVERTRIIGSITRALVAAEEWDAARDLIATPDLQIIVSNVTEAGFQVGQPGDEPAAGVPASFPAKLTDLLYTRFLRLPAGPPLFVIPTELVPDNGPLLRAMVDEITTRRSLGAEFRTWTATHVRFCSSLADRITTGSPAPDDELVTITEPDALWAVEGPPDELHAAFAVDDGERVVFAPDITFYRERKLRLLNGAHTALAPLALLSGVGTVREATEHPRLGPLFRHILFAELVPGSGVPRDQAESFARSVWDRFRNPWLEHPWSVIATNQAEKMRIRVVPSLVRFCTLEQRVPQGLALALAAHLRFTGESHLDESLSAIPALRDAVARLILTCERNGVPAAIEAVLAGVHAET